MITLSTEAARGGVGAGRIALAILAPLAAAVLAYGLWWISDRLLYIGPLDRAAFSWAVVVPLWLLAPVVAGFAWQELGRSERLATALTVAIVVTGAAATLLWLAAAFPDCQYGATFAPADVLGPSSLVGAVIGGSLVVASLATTSLVRSDHPWLGLVVGAGMRGVLLFVGLSIAFGVMFVVLGHGSCERPPIS